MDFFRLVSKFIRNLKENRSARLSEPAIATTQLPESGPVETTRPEKLLPGNKRDERLASRRNGVIEALKACDKRKQEREAHEALMRETRRLLGSSSRPKLGILLHYLVLECQLIDQAGSGRGEIATPFRGQAAGEK